MEAKNLEIHFADLFNHVNTPVFIIDVKTSNVLHANTASFEVLGYPESKILGFPIEELIEFEQRQEFKNMVKNSLQSTQNQCAVLNWVKPDKEIKKLEVLPSKMKIKSTDQVVQIIARDVTAEQEAAELAEIYCKRLEMTNSILEKLSIADSLTELYNLRYFLSRLEQEHFRADRYGTPYALVNMDIRGFKKINKLYGYSSGDELIKELSKILIESFRKSDLATRFADDKFMVLCPGVTYKGARRLCERLQIDVENRKFFEKKIEIKVSFGIAGFPHHKKKDQELWHAAENALEKGKRSGICINTYNTDDFKE